MAVISALDYASIFPVVAGAIPSVNSLGLAGGTGNEDHLAQMECVGMRKPTAFGHEILTAWLHLTQEFKVFVERIISFYNTYLLV